MGEHRKNGKITKVSSLTLNLAALRVEYGFGRQSATSVEPTGSPLAHCALRIAHCSCYFVATSECVIACTERAIRFCTPTLRINFAT